MEGCRTVLLALALLAGVQPGIAVAAEPGDLPGILASRQLIEARGLARGDIVSLSASPDGARPQRFRIVGAYEPIADPMRLTTQRMEVRLHLPDLLRLTSRPDDPLAQESVKAINVLLREPETAGAFARNVEARFPFLVAGTTRAVLDATNPFPVLERFHLAIAIVTVIGSTAFLLALMVMRAEERAETVGVLRLLGFAKRRVLAEVLVEGLLVALAGALFGVLFSAAMQGLVNRFFQWRYDTTLVFVRVTASIAWRCVALAVPLGVLAGVVASWNLLRRDTAALFRR